MNRGGGPPPPQVWRWLGAIAVLLLVLSVATIAVISAGWVDPKPAGPLAASYALERQEVGAGETDHTRIAEVQAGTYTVRLTAAYAAGEQDSGYGLSLGAEGGYLVAAVSPLGYAAVWKEEKGVQEMVFPWQPWPHVRTGTDRNEIQIDVAGDQVSVRVNRERLWTGTVDLPGSYAGTFLQSFGRNATVAFGQLSVYHD